MKGEVSMDSEEAGPRVGEGSWGSSRELWGNSGRGTGRGCGGGRQTGGLRGDLGARELSHDLLSLTWRGAGARSLHRGDRLGGDSLGAGLKYPEIGICDSLWSCHLTGRADGEGLRSFCLWSLKEVLSPRIDSTPKFNFCFVVVLLIGEYLSRS